MKLTKTLPPCPDYLESLGKRYRVKSALEMTTRDGLPFYMCSVVNEETGKLNVLNYFPPGTVLEQAIEKRKRDAEMIASLPIAEIDDE